jgi:hypothetical protein
MSKSKEHFYPLDDDYAKQLELVIIEPNRSIDINVFDVSIFDVRLPPIVKVIDRLHNVN